MATATHSTVEALRTCLQDYLTKNSALASLVLATPDGRTVIALVKQQANANKLAAMSSSLLALAEQLSQTEDHGDCQQLLLETGSGLICLRRVTRSLVLTLTAPTTDLNLGFMAHHSRQCEKLIVSSLKTNERE